MPFPASFLDELNNRNPIEDVVGQYVSLTRKGSNLFGLCPFHSEKTPSFFVYPQTQSFYCFGCGAGGDVITFIRRIENLAQGRRRDQLHHGDRVSELPGRGAVSGKARGAGGAGGRAVSVAVSTKKKKYQYHKKIAAKQWCYLRILLLDRQLL